MKKKIRWMTHAIVCFAVFFCGRVFAANDTLNFGKDVVATPIGVTSINLGQIHKGYYGPAGTTIYPIQHVWQQDAQLFLGYDALIKQKLHLKLTAGGSVTFSTPQIATQPVTMQTHYNFYIDNAYGDYSLGNPDKLFLKFQLGLFPYKYNPDVRNLGEYLFRTLAYPLIVYSEFDKPWVDMLGLRINFQFADKLIENDLLLHSELLSMPVQDWSLSDIVSSTIANVVTLGAGISFSHYFSVYQGQYPLTLTDPYFYPQNLPSGQGDKMIDGVDTAKLGWESARVMGRISLDPKPLIPLSIFGKNDLKLYGELDIIGLKNYPTDSTHGDGYDSLSDRTFYSFGFNFPGFNIIDLINMEFEYCANGSAFSDEKIYGSVSPSLHPLNLAACNPKIKRALWRWSVYVKKSFFDDHFSIIAQAARDHKKLNYYFWDKTNMSFKETLPTVHDWWWTFKTEFKF